MGLLDQTPLRAGVPARPTVTSYCDGCHTLAKVMQVKTVRGVQWLCVGCAPSVRPSVATPHSPTPPDAVLSPEIAQWMEPPAPPPPVTDDTPQPPDRSDDEWDQVFDADDDVQTSAPPGTTP